MATAQVQAVDCCADCPHADCPTRAHHDRLLTVDTDAGELLALLELAVTWHELDYSGGRVVGPEAWPAFATRHRWRDPQRAERAFSLALDIVGRARPAAQPAEVLRLVRS